MRTWFAEGASVAGESHILRGRPNDDALAIKQHGHWTAIVVSDGAGSSVRAREGSNLVSELFVVELLTIATQLEKVGPGPWLNDAVIKAVLQVRAELASLAGSYDLKNFHCTLVAALMSSKGGFTVHIGDGAIIVGRMHDKSTIEIEVHSHPENGEYANETFFITESTWLKSIRIKPLGSCEWVILTTDGAASVLMDKAIKGDAVQALFQLLLEHSKVHSLPTLLAKYLESDYAKSCSNDDKTLAIMYREEQTPSLFSEFVPTADGSQISLPESQGDEKKSIPDLPYFEQAQKRNGNHEGRKHNAIRSRKKLMLLAFISTGSTLVMGIAALMFYLGSQMNKDSKPAGSSLDQLDPSTETDSRR
jgi:hypothetical protein